MGVKRFSVGVKRAPVGVKRFPVGVKRAPVGVKRLPVGVSYSDFQLLCALDSVPVCAWPCRLEEGGSDS